MVPIVTTVHRYWIYSYINIFSDISNLSIIFKLIYNVGTSFLKKKKELSGKLFHFCLLSVQVSPYFSQKDSKVQKLNPADIQTRLARGKVK